MATIFTHAVLACSATYALPLPEKYRSWSRMLTAALCAVLPDLDVVGFKFGIRYADIFGHRGFTHSFLFALFCGLAACALFREKPWQRTGLVCMLVYTAITFSHGLLDAFTNGGLGVALFSPFDNSRMFFSYRPLQVSPIGTRFFSAAAWPVLRSEFIFVCVPCACWCSFANILRRI